MAEPVGPNRVELEYCFDRLSREKIAQVYWLLVPRKKIQKPDDDRQLTWKERDRIENGGDICAGVLGTAEGRADY
jgi:hypothetical protein